MLIAENEEGILAAAALDLDRCSLGELLLAPESGDGDRFASLVIAAERLAVAFGMEELRVQLPPSAAGRFRALGFKGSANGPLARETPPVAQQLTMQRSLRRRQTRYGRRVRMLADELGIPSDYGRRHRLPLQPEATRLTSIGLDIYGREQRLAPPAAAAWRRMQRGAAGSDIELQLVSAWRSVNYQCDLVQRKIAKGLSMEEILSVSAAPGFSEHHTGRALDITTPGFAVLEEEFERSPAFHWMAKHAQEFGFRLSFPRNNRHRLAYEPWHWCFAS